MSGRFDGGGNMRRRELLAGAGALATVGGAAVFVHGGVGNSDDIGRSDSDTIEPVTLPRIDAPGSPPGDEQIPRPGVVSFVEVFATWCPTCQANMSELVEAESRVEDIQFVSVTNEPVGQTVSREEVAAWWREHDGGWPVAHDDDLELTRRLDVNAVPLAAVVDADNVVRWTSSGEETADAVVEAIRDARES